MKLWSTKETTQQSSFQRIVEPIYAIAIATLGDWLKDLAPVFSTNENQNHKPIAPCTRDFSRALNKLQAGSSDWIITLLAPVVIGRSNYFGICPSKFI